MLSHSYSLIRFVSIFSIEQDDKFYCSEFSIYVKCIGVKYELDLNYSFIFIVIVWKKLWFGKTILKQTNNLCRKALLFFFFLKI